MSVDTQYAVNTECWHMQISCVTYGSPGVGYYSCHGFLPGFKFITEVSAREQY
jgi:hypothetical protein